MFDAIKNMMSDLTPKRCAVCDKVLVGRYRVDFWGQGFCEEHGIECLCHNCMRVTRPTDIHLPDGRHICAHCKDKVVVKDAHIEWVYSRLLEIFKNNFLTLPAKISIEIVPLAKMAQLSHAPQDRVPMGLTQSGGSGLFMAPMHHKIYMRDYLHKVVFGGVLAHELLHVWQNEHHIKLPQPYCEGFCNMGTYLFYSYLNNELSEKLVENMMRNPDPIYGDGFRTVKQIFETRGSRNLEKTMEILKNLR